MRDPKTIEEWAKRCSERGHNACFCCYTLCLACARAFARQQVEAWAKEVTYRIYRIAGGQLQ